MKNIWCDFNQHNHKQSFHYSYEFGKLYKVTLFCTLTPQGTCKSVAFEALPLVRKSHDVEQMQSAIVLMGQMINAGLANNTPLDAIITNMHHQCGLAHAQKMPVQTVTENRAITKSQSVALSLIETLANEFDIPLENNLSLQQRRKTLDYFPNITKP